MNKMLLLGALLLTSMGLADRTPDNLRPFTKVCANAYYEAGGEEDEDVALQLISRMETALKKAKIAVVPGQCQEKGNAANKQLNLYFSFVTTDELDARSSMLEGWLQKEGVYKELTLWWDNLFGSLDDGNVPLTAASDLDDLLDNFIADWKKSH